MKIVFVNTQLSTGGIATSLVNLCEQLKNYIDIEIDLILLDKKYGDIRYNIPNNVNAKFINEKKWNLYSTPFNEILKSKNIIEISNAIYIKILSKLMSQEKFMKFIMKNMRLLDKYDVAISFRNDEYQHNPHYICGCNDFVLQCIDANKKIAWIHNDPDRHGFTYEICRDKFKEFDTIVNVSKGCKDRFDKIIPEFKHKSELVYNSFNYDSIVLKSRQSNPYPKSDKVKLVTVGRISNDQKRIDRIIEVCENLKNKNINNYIWYIVGDGPDLNILKDRVEKLSLKEFIVFVGKQSNPYRYMKFADCLVMTSEYEAFGMTLVESLIVGTPVITTNHIAAKEIVREYVNGFIVENNSKAIQEKIELILKDNKILEDIKENARKYKVDKQQPINQFLNIINYYTKDVTYEN